MKKEVKRRPRVKYTQQEVEEFVLEEEYPTSGKFKDLTGEIFGKWKVLKYCGKEGKIHPKYFCLCTGCSEGNIQKVYGHHLKKGISTSCGCERDSKIAESARWSNRLPFSHHEDILKTYKEDWQLNNIIRTPLTYEAYCPVCNRDFSIKQSSVLLKGGGCKCTMLSSNGFDYNMPAWFYIFKISGEEGTYWKYGVTQKQKVTERNFSLVDGFSRELIFYTAIRDRWDTIILENKFKEYFEKQGLSSTIKGEVCKSGWTECFPDKEGISPDKLITFFWGLNPKVVPFHTSNLKDITTNKNNSLSTGVVKYFNLDKKERDKYYAWCKNRNINPYEVDLTNPLTFDKISKYINKIRGG